MEELEETGEIFSSSPRLETEAKALTKPRDDRENFLFILAESTTLVSGGREPTQAEGDVFRYMFIRSSDCGEGEESKPEKEEMCLETIVGLFVGVCVDRLGVCQHETTAKWRRWIRWFGEGLRLTPE